VTQSHLRSVRRQTSQLRRAENSAFVNFSTPKITFPYTGQISKPPKNQYGNSRSKHKNTKDENIGAAAQALNSGKRKQTSCQNISQVVRQRTAGLGHQGHSQSLCFAQAVKIAKI
jgi:hypothetical protein